MLHPRPPSVGWPHFTWLQWLNGDGSAVDITMIAAGTPFTFPKQPVEGGVGGNP